MRIIRPALTKRAIQIIAHYCLMKRAKDNVDKIVNKDSVDEIP